MYTVEQIEKKLSKTKRPITARTISQHAAKYGLGVIVGNKRMYTEEDLNFLKARKERGNPDIENLREKTLRRKRNDE